PRHDGADFDIVCAGEPEFLVQRATQAQDRGLRRSICILQGERRFAVDRPRVYESSVSLGAELAQCSMGAIDEAFQVYVDHPCVILDRYVQKYPMAPTPTLFTQTSIRPNAASAASHRAATCPESLTST